jgi:hypothetical protein
MKLVQSGSDLTQLLISKHFSSSLFKFSYNLSCSQIIDESHVCTQWLQNPHPKQTPRTIIYDIFIKIYFYELKLLNINSNHRKFNYQISIKHFKQAKYHHFLQNIIRAHLFIL